MLTWGLAMAAKRKGKVSKSGDSRCVGCGELLTPLNSSLDSKLCKNCFMVEMAEIEAEDLEEDSLTDEERTRRSLGY
jgi:hypothetical protein